MLIYNNKKENILVKQIQVINMLINNIILNINFLSDRKYFLYIKGVKVC